MKNEGVLWSNLTIFQQLLTKSLSKSARKSTKQFLEVNQSWIPKFVLVLLKNLATLVKVKLFLSLDNGKIKFVYRWLWRTTYPEPERQKIHLWNYFLRYRLWISISVSLHKSWFLLTLDWSENVVTQMKKKIYFFLLYFVIIISIFLYVLHFFVIIFIFLKHIAHSIGIFPRILTCSV